MLILAGASLLMAAGKRKCGESYVGSSVIAAPFTIIKGQ
jgi:hypothetical protein